MTTIPTFKALLAQKASDTRYHKVDSLVACPCRTPEGFRDPEWHLANMGAEVCNEAGFLPDPANTIDVIVKAFVQPIQSTRATRLTTEQVLIFFGEVQTDDHLGIFPYDWEGTQLNFRGWGRSGEDFIEYAEQRFFVVNANLLPDPSDGNPYHHWEVALRLINPMPT